MFDIFGRRAVGVSVRRLLHSIPSYNEVCIYLHQLVVRQTFSPRQTMQEGTAVNVDTLWQLRIKMFGQ